MSNEQMQHLVDIIAARLLARVNNAVAISQDALRHASATALFLKHDTLHVQHTDICFLRQLADGDQENTAVANLFEAFSLGMKVTVSINSSLLRCLPLAGLATLPLSLCDEHENSIRYCKNKVLSYRDILGLGGGWVVTSRKTIITVLAREAMATQHIRLVQQE
ncbi:PduM family microcompartment protein [Yokenella regensburgei]|uniref:PduM family microcompartment protein n=1 Tax=Yokenella regensburgei TaxID=158877 RepID=UPI003F13C29F